VSSDPIEKPKQLGMGTSVHDGQVILHFTEPREYLALTNLEPVVVGGQMLRNAIVADESTTREVIDVCMALMDFAYEVRGDLKPAGGAVKHELIERHRKTLTNRLVIVMKKLREQKTMTNDKLVKEVLDIVFHEVFA
jgi:hypothetical protein